MKKGFCIDMAGDYPNQHLFQLTVLLKWSQKYLDKRSSKFHYGLVLIFYFWRTCQYCGSFCVTSCYQWVCLPQEEAAQEFAGDVFAGWAKRDILEANQSGVQGAPFFVLNNKYGISGAQLMNTCYGIKTIKQSGKEHNKMIDTPFSTTRQQFRRDRFSLWDWWLQHRALNTSH